jgi:hypothetical protein
LFEALQKEFVNVRVPLGELSADLFEQRADLLADGLDIVAHDAGYTAVITVPLTVP